MSSDPDHSARLKGLFLNTKKARCSIFESGVMAYKCLILSQRYALDYQEVDFKNRRIPRGYDFYVLNYHDTTSMSWLDTRSVQQLPGLKIAIVLEVAPNNPFVRISDKDFDAYVVLDPSISRVARNVYPFPRPLETPPYLDPLPAQSRPVIGTFGLPTSGKGFDKLVAAVNREFDQAVVRMNIPSGDYVSTAQSQEIEGTIEQLKRAAKPGVEVVITRDFMTKPELIRWCSQNTLNAFLYDRAMTGLAATTDQAISSGRPLAVSANETFRHVHSYLAPYPFRSLAESIERSAPEVAAMRQAWSPASFARTFEQMLEDLPRPTAGQRSGQVTLRPRLPLPRSLPRVEWKDLVPPAVSRVSHEIRRLVRKQAGSAVAPANFSSPLLASFSPHGEDLWLDLVLRWKATGFYVDVGGLQPRSGSHTYRFYRRGWSGVNVEPTAREQTLLMRQRPRDVNLQAAIRASHAEAGPPAQSAVRALTLSQVFDEYVGSKVVDFLSVDAVASSFEILDSLDWDRYRPMFALVTMSERRDAIVQTLQRKDYGLLMNNHVNGLFVDVASQAVPVRDLLAGAPAIKASSEGH